MKSVEREEAVRLRLEEQLGFGEIAKKIGVSKSTLSRWLQDLPLSEERILELRRAAWGRGEAKRERFRETMRQKRLTHEQEVYEVQKRKFNRISEQSLFVAGLMLYVAEGDKKTRAEIAFSNTDPVLIRFFMRWLERFLEVPHGKFRAQLHLYENMDLPKEERFWREQLGLEKSQFCKTQVRPVRAGSFSYREPFRHGTCKLYLGGVAKKTELMLSIRAFFDTYERHLRA